MFCNVFTTNMTQLLMTLLALLLAITLVVSKSPSPTAKPKSTPATSTTSVPSAQLMSKFKSCWNRSDWTLLFHKLACHQGWLHRLFANDIVSIDSIEAIGLRHDTDTSIANENGAFRVLFKDGYKGIFKVCDAVPGGYSYESWKGEVISHAIDRVFAINRSPGVVPRSLNIYDLKIIGNSSTVAKLTKNRDAVAKVCQGGRKVMFGSLMGWTETNVEELGNYHEKYSAHTIFDVDHIQQHNVEFVRTVISLYLTGQPHKFNHNVFDVPNPVNKDLFLVSLDNDRASWQPNEASEDAKFDPKLPACNRALGHSTFNCHNFAIGRKDHMVISKISMKHLESLLSTACIFPRTIASRVRRFGEATNKMHPSSLVMSYVNDSLGRTTKVPGADTNIFSYIKWTPSILDQRVTFLANTLHSCVQKYGYSGTIFGTEEPTT